MLNATACIAIAMGILHCEQPPEPQYQNREIPKVSLVRLYIWKFNPKLGFTVDYIIGEAKIEHALYVYGEPNAVIPRITFSIYRYTSLGLDFITYDGESVGLIKRITAE
jgi:hypothetical protein